MNIGGWKRYEISCKEFKWNTWSFDAIQQWIINYNELKTKVHSQKLIFFDKLIFLKFYAYNACEG